MCGPIVQEGRTSNFVEEREDVCALHFAHARFE